VFGPGADDGEIVDFLKGAVSRVKRSRTKPVALRRAGPHVPRHQSTVSPTHSQRAQRRDADGASATACSRLATDDSNAPSSVPLTGRRRERPSLPGAEQSVHERSSKSGSGEGWGRAGPTSAGQLAFERSIPKPRSAVQRASQPARGPASLAARPATIRYASSPAQSSAQPRDQSRHVPAWAGTQRLRPRSAGIRRREGVDLQRP